MFCWLEVRYRLHLHSSGGTYTKAEKPEVVVIGDYPRIQDKDLNKMPRLGHRKSTGKNDTLVGYTLDLFIFPSF